MLLFIIIIILVWIFSHGISMIHCLEEDNNIIEPDIYNSSEHYSPITLLPQSNFVVRIALTFGGTIIGITSTAFFVATFFISDEVQKLGNLFLVNVGLSELFMTSVVMLASCVVLLAPKLDILFVCQLVQAGVSTSTYCYSTFLFLVGLVTWGRVNQIHKVFIVCCPFLTIGISFLVLAVSISLAIAGTFFRLDIDYCRRQHRGNDIFRFITTAYHILTFILTILCFIFAYIKLGNITEGCGRYRYSFQYIRDTSMIKLNVVLNVLFVAFWAPFMIVVNYFPDAPNNIFYSTASVAIFRSTLASLIYCLSITVFHRAFSNLFNYWFCKMILQPIRSRTNRAIARQNRNAQHIMMQPIDNATGQAEI